MAYVISGAIRSQVEGEPARVYQAGETWQEAPGAHHTISEFTREDIDVLIEQGPDLRDQPKPGLTATPPLAAGVPAPAAAPAAPAEPPPPSSWGEPAS